MIEEIKEILFSVNLDSISLIVYIFIFALINFC